MTAAASLPSHRPAGLLPGIQDVEAAAARMQDIIRHTPLEKSEYLSRKYDADIRLKREDLQPVRSFKIRGAYNRISRLSATERRQGIVCASAGNHAQGVAFSCNALDIHGTLFMPANTPTLKVNKVRQLGGLHVDIVLVGHTFDDACQAARAYQQARDAIFIHPFDDADVIAGQGTLALEVLADSPASIDCLFIPVGGGGLASGIGTVFQARSPATRLIGVEPRHAAALHRSLQAGSNQSLTWIDPFIDGAATQRIGELGFEICRNTLDSVITVADSLACRTLIELYQEAAIVAELAGCLSIAALEQRRDEIRGKTVVCILSGGNNDFGRSGEILRRARL